MRRQLGNSRRLVLAVAVKSHDAVVTLSEGGIKSCAQAGAVTQITRMADCAHALDLAQEVRRSVGRAVINDKHVGGVLFHLREHALEVRCFVVDRDRGEQAHGRNDRRKKVRGGPHPGEAGAQKDDRILSQDSGKSTK